MEYKQFHSNFIWYIYFEGLIKVMSINAIICKTKVIVDFRNCNRSKGYKHAMPILLTFTAKLYHPLLY